jgi:radical SAM protein with 4Fe4S-binding SPASM domain
MACHQIPELPLDQFGRDYIRKWSKNRVPINGSIELDLRCNLRCRHCYRDGDWPPGVMSTEELTGLLDQIAEAGTLWLLLTGGEVFLRRDFFEIYEHARTLGLLVTIFTNGTMVTEKIADRLAQFPPYNIEITLYGFSQETYEKVTGVEGSWRNCYRGVELLVERGLPLRLKTVVMKTNRHELLDMYHYAEELGLHFKYDTMINPHLSGSLEPCNVRLDPEEVVQDDFAVPGREASFRKYFEPRKTFHSDRLFVCGAGRQSFHVDPYGMMKMCLLLREPEFSLREMSFREIWEKEFPKFLNWKRSPDHPCNRCNLGSLCGNCPAWSRLETGDMESRVEYCCEVGHRRARRLGYSDGPIERHSRSGNDVGNEILLPANPAS